MPGKSFFDTNVFVYAFDTSAPVKAEIANSLIRRALADKSLAVISYQVVQEFVSVSLRRGVVFDSARLNLYLHEVLLPLCGVHSSEQLFEKALEIRLRYQLSWYDSLIVAAALEAGCETLYTEDLQHGQHFDTLMVHNPFM